MRGWWVFQRGSWERFGWCVCASTRNRARRHGDDEYIETGAIRVPSLDQFCPDDGHEGQVNYAVCNNCATAFPWRDGVGDNERAYCSIACRSEADALGVVR